MKVAVVGNGNVGMATFREMQKLREVQELVLIGRNQEKLSAEIEDFMDAEYLYHSPSAKLSCGGYEAAEGADFIIYTAGAGRKPGQSRLELLDENASIARDIFQEIKKVNRDAIIIVVSNPVDVITAVVRQTMELPRERVIGTGTLLDTARLKRYISGMLEVSPDSMSMFVLGEHGDSSFVVWNSVRIIGLTLDEYLSLEIGSSVSVRHSTLVTNVRETAGKIIKAKGYTAYGVAAATSRLIQAIINDTREILPLSVCLYGEYGVEDGISISVPCLIGRDGLLAVKEIALTEEEREAFNRSAAIVRESAHKAGI